MPSLSTTEQALLDKNAELQARLEEAEETLRAIHSGEIDALVVQGQTGPQVYTLQGLDAELNRFRGEILERISEAIIVLDENQHIVYLNGAAEQHYGVKAFAVLGCHVNKVYQTHWLQPGDEAGMKAALSETGHWTGENIHSIANGENLYTEIRITRINDSNVIQHGELVVIRDITARKLAENALRESERRLQLFRHINEHARELIAFIDNDGRYFYVSPSLCEQTGYSETELLALTVDKVDIELNFSRFQALVQALKHTSMPLFESTLKRKDGSTFAVEISATHIEFEGQGYVCGIARDITERKQFEESLREADKRKNEFLAMLGHELRNPLTPIANVASLLSMPPHDERKILWASEILSRNGAHLSRLVDDLLDVSRITQGLVNIQRERVELVAILENAAESVLTLIHKKHQNLTLNLPDPPLTLIGDPVRLTQVFTNLLNNASKYTDENGSITLTAYIEGPSIVVRVQDNGMGIETSLIPHIFDLFMQNERGLARSEGGLGLGLTLVKKLVELHQGQITVNSPLAQQGSEFVVTLPRLVEETAKPVQPLAPQVTMTAEEGLKVLLIDDNRDIVDSLTMALDLWGYYVRTAYNGAEGICIAQDFEPDVILLDIGLPDMDGYQVARKLREQPALQSSLIIAQSGYVPNQGELSEKSFDHYLIKPPKLNQLQELFANYQQSKPHS
jgi:PAS domain S-box-containing protein